MTTRCHVTPRYAQHYFSMCNMTFFCTFDMKDPWLVCRSDMTHSYVWHNPLTSAIRLVDMCSITDPWLVCRSDMTHSNVWHIPLTSATWLVDMCNITDPWLVCRSDMTHSNVWHNPLTSATWLVDTCNVTHSFVRHDTPMARSFNPWRIRLINVHGLLVTFFTHSIVKFITHVFDTFVGYLRLLSLIRLWCSWLIHLIHVRGLPATLVTHSIETFIIHSFIPRLWSMTHPFNPWLVRLGDESRRTSG